MLTLRNAKGTIHRKIRQCEELRLNEHGENDTLPTKVANLIGRS
jgi:hypothetical protein